LQREGERVEGNKCVYCAGIHQCKKVHIRAAYISLRRQQTYTNSAGVYQSRKDNKVAPKQRILLPSVLVYNKKIYQQDFSVFYRSYSQVKVVLASSLGEGFHGGFFGKLFKYFIFAIKEDCLLGFFSLYRVSPRYMRCDHACW
jgi:hypothetical protein